MTTTTTMRPGEFDYKRAWCEWAYPKFLALPADIRDIYHDIRDDHGDLRQNRGLGIDCPPELESRFENIAAEFLARAIPIVYAYGHWGSGWAMPNDGGAYWKFKILGKQALVAKDRAGAWVAHECDTQAFIVPHPHETAIDDALRDSGLRRHDVTNVNFDPHPFVIGARHLENSRGMYLEPNCAPCAMRGCNLTYEEHRSERVLVLKGLEQPVPTEQEVAICFLAPVLKEHGLDGIVFLKE